MTLTASTQAIIDLEDQKPAILFERFHNSDVHVWPYLRLPLVQSMAEIELSVTPISSPISMRQRLSKLFGQVLPDRTSARNAPAGKSVLFVVAGRTQADTAAGNKNWLVDDFAAEFGDKAVVVQYRELPREEGRVKSRVFGETYSFHDDELKGDIRARLRPLSRSALHSTQEIVHAVYSELDFDVDQRSIEIATAKVTRHQARVESMRSRYEALLDRVNPRIVVMDGAAYGGSRAIQVRLAKERGLPVAELQHGWIGSSHSAYNFGAAAWEAQLFQYLPDTLLTFGDFWSRDLLCPFDTFTVGKPHLNALAQHSQPLKTRERVVLVASSTTNRPEITSTVFDLRRSLPNDWRVWFRPHPSELASVDELYPDLVGVSGIEIDRSLDVYESLGRVRGVFGFASTVLYEALKFGCPTFVLDSQLAKYYADRTVFGEPLSGAADIQAAVSLITSDTAPLSSASLDELWAPDPQARFRKFVDNVLGSAE